MSFDLHTHSRYSDGLYTPPELIRAALRKQLKGIALTDHDSLNGLTEFLVTGEREGVVAIPGVEITTQHNGVEIHILGYCIDSEHLPLRKRLRQVIDSRNKRARKILRLLEKAGLKLTWEELSKHTTGESVGRPHIYRALKEKGYIGDDPERAAFDYYLGPRGVAYVPHQELDTLEAIELVREAGGFPVLAHPGRMDDTGLIGMLVEKGLAGIEVFYPTHPPELRAEYLKLAGKLGIFPTGGSDFHGIPGEVELGAATVEEEFIEPLLA